MSNSELTIETKTEDDQLIYTFTGAINEDFTFGHLLEQKASTHIFDFDSVSLLNSCGIREWIRFVEQLGNEVKIIYRNCPPIVVLQMNMVKGFLSDNATVESFYAPYYDDENDRELKVLLHSDEIKELQAPKKLNDAGKPLEFDGVEATYFRFLNR